MFGYDISELPITSMRPKLTKTGSLGESKLVSMLLSDPSPPSVLASVKYCPSLLQAFLHRAAACYYLNSPNYICTFEPKRDLQIFLSAY